MNFPLRHQFFASFSALKSLRVPGAAERRVGVTDYRKQPEPTDQYEPKHEAFWLRLSQVIAIFPMDTPTLFHQLRTSRQHLILILAITHILLPIPYGRGKSIPATIDTIDAPTPSYNYQTRQKGISTFPLQTSKSGITKK